MVTGLSGAPASAHDPHIRPLDAWRDGAAVANLLELAFRDEGIDDSGQRVLHMLRHYSGAFGFVWVEDGQVVGNVSLQSNPTRRDTWVIGNVATHPARRNRGIGTALINTAVSYARAHGARGLALQVVDGNAPALRVYERIGFRALGAVAHYRRPSVRIQPPAASLGSDDGLAVRRARLADREQVWRLTRWNVPDELTYAEPFEAGAYLLGWRWWLSNALRGNREQWFLAERGPSILGAIRARVNFDMAEHHVELMLGEGADAPTGVALLSSALQRFVSYLSKPLYCVQSRPHETSQAALQSMGFKPIRTLVHMHLALEE